MGKVRLKDTGYLYKFRLRKQKYFGGFFFGSSEPLVFLCFFCFFKFFYYLSSCKNSRNSIWRLDVFRFVSQKKNKIKNKNKKN